MYQEEEFSEKKIFVKIDVEGNDTALWSKLKISLTEMIKNICEFKVNNYTGGNVEDEFKRISANVIEYANAKLERPSIENQKLLAEIDVILANRAKEIAETRKINAEAEKIELENICKRLTIAIGAAKILAQSSNNQEALLFVKNIEELSFIFNDKKLID